MSDVAVHHLRPARNHLLCKTTDIWAIGTTKQNETDYREGCFIQKQISLFLEPSVPTLFSS